uniref:Uncharacterized protein n=1 Tax=Romanomermis culicivorax TaxID=13658 RepID=A0A915K7T4_ROMCU
MGAKARRAPNQKMSENQSKKNDQVTKIYKVEDDFNLTTSNALSFSNGNSEDAEETYALYSITQQTLLDN